MNEGRDTTAGPVITNPACPCWSGYHHLHRPVCGCTTCETPPAREAT